MSRSILGLRLHQRVRNAEILRLVKVNYLQREAHLVKWRWAGHVARMTADRWAKICTEWVPRDRTGQEDDQPPGGEMSFPSELETCGSPLLETGVCSIIMLPYLMLLTNDDARGASMQPAPLLCATGISPLPFYPVADTHYLHRMRSSNNGVMLVIYGFGTVYE
ncbi:hypothetical protein LSTR_LSTR007746 [Laodelphax striatellus]|uniref:Uncharacterized protein n=1 Tax=Laodelphax striatellus TaxID=195883 RepID=A0A482WJT5_LAOST|nr:hypothetical protein LSTR_LSTR007746 [Laodelphax striatellus]